MNNALGWKLKDSNNNKNIEDKLRKFEFSNNGYKREDKSEENSLGKEK